MNNEHKGNRSAAGVPQDVAQEIAQMARAVKRRPADTEPVKQGVADELATFIENHADEMMKEAEQHRQEAYAYAKEIRDRTAEQLARLKAFTDSIKASQAEMAEVRMRFLSASTTPTDGGGVAQATQSQETES